MTRTNRGSGMLFRQRSILSAEDAADQCRIDMAASPCVIGAAGEAQNAALARDAASDRRVV